MERSANLSMPYIMPSQAQKHLTHNEALRMLDALVQLSVRARTHNAPPAEPAPGERHIVGAAPSGAWAGREGALAAYQDGAWALFDPRPGWLAFVEDEARLLAFDGTQWTEITGSSAPTALLGVNTDPDETNRLAVAAPATLFTHEGEGHQLKLNKAAGGDTASILFQTGFSGRAEMGTVGDVDFHFKVSPDGTTWHEAIVIDRTSGAVRLPASGQRERLSASRTYFVRPDGNDANDGRADEPGRAFASVQRALDLAYGDIDLGPYDLTIQLADGTYAQAAQIRGAQVGAGTITLRGNPVTPGATVLAGQAGASATIVVENGATLYLRDLEIGAVNGWCLDVSAATVRLRGGLRFAATGTGSTQINVLDNGVVESINHPYAVVGNAPRHINVVDGGVGQLLGTAINVDGRHFSTAFATAYRGGVLRINGAAFTGTATGKRYDVSTNAVIFANDGAGTRLPGDAPGTAATGGVYA